MADVHDKAFFDAVASFADAVKASPGAMAVDSIRESYYEMGRAAKAANQAAEEEFQEMLRLTAEQPSEILRMLGRYLVPAQDQRQDA